MKNREGIISACKYQHAYGIISIMKSIRKMTFKSITLIFVVLLVPKIAFADCTLESCGRGGEGIAFENIYEFYDFLFAGLFSILAIVISFFILTKIRGRHNK